MRRHAASSSRSTSFSLRTINIEDDEESTPVHRLSKRHPLNSRRRRLRSYLHMLFLLLSGVVVLFVTKRWISNNFLFSKRQHERVDERHMDVDPSRGSLHVVNGVKEEIVKSSSSRSTDTHRNVLFWNPPEGVEEELAIEWEQAKSRMKRDVQYSTLAGSALRAFIRSKRVELETLYALLFGRRSGS